jgi:signal transduction histidine kinase
MKTSLRTRLALSYLVVILVGMAIITPLAWLAVEGLYLNTQSASLLAQAELVASALKNQLPLDTGPIPYSQTSNTLPGIHTRIIDAQGGVVIDLAASLAGTGALPLVLPQLAQDPSGQVTAEELLARPEIAQALNGSPATAVRTLAVAGGKRVLYAAAPVLSPNGSVLQIVYLATPLPETGLAALPVEVRWQFAGVFLLAVLLAGGAGLLLSRRIARPLTELAQAASGVAAGDLGQKVPEDRSIHELAALGQAFNTMTANLRQSDQAKTAFISDVSHELRTPLTVIKGTIETLEDGAMDDLSARGPFLASMNRETERLIRLVNDLLVLTRADASALNLQLQPLDMVALARARCDQLGRRASQRQVRLVVETADSSAGSENFTVQGDPDRLAQVLDNLLDNAIRYAPPESAVTVSVCNEDGGVACRVTDVGPGIPASHLPFIFERFYRVDPSRGRGQGGSGLGLAIVRSLVQAHGGRVSAASQESHGTAVTFWLPAAR